MYVRSFLSRLAQNETYWLVGQEIGMETEKSFEFWVFSTFMQAHEGKGFRSCLVVIAVRKASVGGLGSERESPSLTFSSVSFNGVVYCDVCEI